MNQQTIKSQIEFSGTGLHTGGKVSIKLAPADENYGIVFKRVDLKSPVEIPARYPNVVSTRRSITLGINGQTVKTVEHLLAALYALDIDNVLIEADGEEMPALDGSAYPFAKEIFLSGAAQLPAKRTDVELSRPIYFKQGDSFVFARPSSGLNITMVANFDHPMVGTQVFEFCKEKDNFMKELAPARTFGFWEEVAELHKNNLALGGGLDNAIVIKKDSYMTELKFKDEIARHKCLDFLGDLALLGAGLKADIYVYKSSHNLDVEFLKKIVKSQEVKVMDINEILKVLPHRYPFLLVDRVLELEDDKRAVGIKNVTFNEPFFAGHFPSKPIMPGVLIIEAMAQVGGIMLLNKRRNENITPYFVGIDKVKFRKSVIPGDQLVLEADVISIRGNQMGKVKTTAKVNDKVVAEGELMFALVRDK